MALERKPVFFVSCKVRPLGYAASGPFRPTPGSTTRTPLIDTGSLSAASPTLVHSHRDRFEVLAVIVAAMLSSSRGNLRLGFDHPRSASSTAVSSNRPQNANRIRLSGSRLANATPAGIAAMPPSASGNPTSQSTLPASA
jgi:hypothetical protein